MLQAYQELATILLNYHIDRIVLGSMCVGVSVWLGWSGIRVAVFSLHTDTTPRQDMICDKQLSEVCHPGCAFKLYGEVNSVKKRNYKIWLNDGVY